MVASTASVPRRRRRAPQTPADLLPDNVYTAYLRVSTKEQAESHAGLDWQESVVQMYEKVHGLEIREWRVDPGFTAANLNRPGLVAALADVRTGHTRGIIIAKLDRLSRSVIDFSGLMQEALRDDWNMVSVDLGVDLRTTNGRLIAGLMMQIAEWERHTISDRTREGLESKRKQGVRLGRPRGATDDLLAMVIGMYLQARNYSEAARRLNDTGIGTVQGGRLWYPATVRDMVFSQDGQSLLTDLGEVA